MQNCCGEWSVKQGVILIGVFTLMGSILWLAWQTRQILFLEDILDGEDDPCDPNPCYHGGVCFPSTDGDNPNYYVCDCVGTGFSGINCNASMVQRVARKSCAEYWLEGERTPGKYLIDPDGPDDLSMDPIEIECKFTENRAYTMVTHKYRGKRKLTQRYVDVFANLENVVVMRPAYLEYIKNHEDLSDYIGAIIDQAHHCEQTFTFECKDWPLYPDVNGDDTGGEPTHPSTTRFTGGLDIISTDLALLAEETADIVSGTATPATIPPTATTGATDSTTFTYERVNQTDQCRLDATGTDRLCLDMSGRNISHRDWQYTHVDTTLDQQVVIGSGRYQCQCRIDGTCDSDVDPDAHRCNCDLKSDQFRQDVAVFTKKDHRDYLPIAFVYIPGGYDISSDSEAYATLSPLMCYEEFEVTDPYSKYRDGGRGRNKDDKWSSWHIEGFKIMWGCVIAFMCITALLLVASLILLMGSVLDSKGAMMMWVIVMILMNIMVFILLVVRWHFLGFGYVVWELACMFVWICLTFYGLSAVLSFMGMSFS